MKKTVSILVLGLSLSTFSSKGGLINCPSIGFQAQELINSARNLAESLGQDEQCSDIKSKLTKISNLTSTDGWQTVKKLVSSTGSGDISLLNNPDDLEAISATTKDISSLLASTISTISGQDNECKKSTENKSFLSGLSGIIRDVSKTVSNLTGPYGFAVNLGGSFISQAISGFDEFYFKKNKSFNSDEDMEIFLNQFCSYSNTLMDFTDFVDLESRKKSLETLDGYLDQKISSLEDNCTQCKFISTAIKTKSKMRGSYAALSNLTKKYQSKINTEYKIAPRVNLCKDIESNIHRSANKSHLKNIIDVTKDYLSHSRNFSEVRGKSYIQEDLNIIIEGFSDSGNFYPKYSACRRMSIEEKTDISTDFLVYLEDEILPIQEKIDFEILKMTEKANEIYVKPLGSYVSLSYQRKAWIKKEIKSINETEQTSSYNPTEHAAIISARNGLSTRISSLLPRFLDYIADKKIMDNIRSKKKFSSSKKQTKAIGQLGEAIRYSAVLNQYCNYITYIGHAGPSSNVQTFCSPTGEVKTKINNKLNEVSQYQVVKDKSAKSIKKINAGLWTKAPTLRRGGEAQDYTNLIGNWIQRGETRWLKK